MIGVLYPLNLHTWPQKTRTPPQKKKMQTKDSDRPGYVFGLFYIRPGRAKSKAEHGNSIYLSYIERHACFRDLGKS